MFGKASKNIRGDQKDMLSENIDEQAFLKAYEIFVPKLFRHIYFRINMKEDAEDLTSQVFLKTWVYLRDSRNEIKDLKNFLYRTAHNLIIDYYRKKPRAPLPINEKFEKTFFYEKDIVQEINSQEELQMVRDAIYRLKKDFRDVVVLRYVDDFSIEEIASITQKSKNVIYITLSRAIKELKLLTGEESN